MAKDKVLFVNGITKKEHNRLHKLLIKKYGKASCCKSSNCTNKNPKRFEWALKKGHSYSEYKEDYIELCVSCHRKYDFTEDIRSKLKARKLGELHNASKLTNNQVLEVSKMIADEVMVKDIAKKFNVDSTTISNIKTGKRWSYLTKIKTLL